MNEYYIGLMSGTSIDSIDAALLNFNQKPPQILATHSLNLSKNLRESILNVYAIDILASLDTELGELFAEAAIHLLKKTNITASEIKAIGSHGQTILHQPDLKFPYTLQIGNPHIIASRTGITTVADFRRKDIALGGQGAPLVPAFHEYLFRDFKNSYWILNIGGIANLTYLPKEKGQTILGFDTGPGNVLMDSWCSLHRNEAYDDQGKWAASGTVNKHLLELLKEASYFIEPPPKSTGRDLFNLNWLGIQLYRLNTSIKNEDVQATLLELTASTIADAINEYSASYEALWICGGGFYNTCLIQRISELCANHNVFSTDKVGIPPKFMETAAFAWLAKQTLEKKPGNITTVTGARKTGILGSVIPA